MAKMGSSRIPWCKYVGNIVMALVIVAQVVSVESSAGINDTGSVINPVEQGNLPDFFGLPATENVSTAELSSIGENLQSVIERLSELPGGRVPSNSTLCTSQICKFKNQAEQLLELTEKLEQNKANNSNVHVAKLEEEYRSKYLQFSRTLDDMKGYILFLEKRNGEMVVTLKEFKLKHEEYEIQLINAATAAYLNVHEPQKAYNEFNRLKYNDSNFRIILTQTWLFDSEGMENMLAFIAVFPSCETRAPLYKILFEFMDKNLNISSLYNSTIFYLLFDGTQSCIHHLEDIKEQLSIYRYNITSKWADIIRNDDFQEDVKKIQLFICETLENEDIVNIALFDIVQGVYDNKVENIVITVEFIYNLPNIKDVFKGYETLFNAMTKNRHLHNEGIIKFALRLKQIILDEYFRSDVKEYPYLEYDYYNLLNRFPSLITSLAWEKICTITNFEQTEYLYASDDYFTNVYGSWMSKISTLMTGDKLPLGNMWSFHNQPGYDTFYIRHNYSDYSNYLVLDDRNEVSGYLVTRKINDREPEEYSSSRWKLIPQTVDNQKVFVLKNEWGMQYSPSKGLKIASSVDVHSHLVNYDDWDQKTGYWKVDCPCYVGPTRESSYCN